MKRDKHLRQLSSDHHQALTLVRKIERFLSKGLDHTTLVSEVRQVFLSELSVHFDIEEQTLLPELEKIGESALVERTINDHIEMRRLVQQLNELGNLASFAMRLKAHVRFEEQELFEACQTLLSANSLRAIGRACKTEQPSNRVTADRPAR